MARIRQSFSIPFRDGKSVNTENEKENQIVDDVYKVRTITDVKDTAGNTGDTSVS